ncbi:single-stranded DNA-binding protein [Spinactinospora alkalitolerans]|uniref:Single-stranded DNA-binding protein n=1 Tax=Spinactinospora alkalitolerans TaxID=687207 RepID=A0A852TRK3_9ACTN|nr:single-stranded DNA-binding protein [Spinactinospora alkalitolerans]NYE46588.1 single-stranded DNA-binding protein [Spinactinospora alkalitolerans]
MHKPSTTHATARRAPVPGAGLLRAAAPAGGSSPGRGAPRPARPLDRQGHRNEVVLAGRVTAEPAVRELPSGDHLVTWRLSITRPPAEQRPNQPADPITCVSFRPAMEETTRGWRIGDVVQVTGSLRRRFWRSPNGSASVFEVEAKTARRVDPTDEPAVEGTAQGPDHQPS